MNKIFLTAVLILVGLSQMAQPSERKIKHGKLSIIHQKMEIENNTYKSKKKKKEEEGTFPPLEAKNVYVIHRNEKISIEIKDPNFFLFEYKWKGITKSKTEDFTSLDKLIEAFAPFMEKGKALEATTDDTAIEKGLEDMEKKISELKNKKKEDIKKENLKKKSERDRTKLKDLINDIKNLDTGKKFIKQIEKTGITTKSLKELSENTRNLYKFFKKIPGLTCKISSGLGEAEEVAASIKKSGEIKEKEIFDTYKNIRQVQRILTDNVELIGQLNKFDDLREKIQFISISLLLFKDREADIRNMINKAKLFKTLFRKMYDGNTKKWIPLPLGTVSYSEKEKITAKIEISMADNISEEVKKCVGFKKKKAEKTGTFEIVFEPYTPVKISFGLGQILSSLKEKAEGEEDEKNINLTVPMITITPNFKWWEIKGLRPGFQVGGTVKDKTKNIVMGAGLQLVERLFIGGGLHFRWGDEIELKKGWYINISFNVLPTKLK